MVQAGEQDLQSVADTAIGNQTFTGSYNISGVIAVMVQVFFFFVLVAPGNLPSPSMLTKLISINCN